MVQKPKNEQQSEWREPGTGARDSAPAPKKRRGRVCPYAVMLLAAWGLIFGAVFWSHFLSDLPDTTKLLVKSSSQDVTILDDKGRLIARRGLTQGARVDVSRLPSFVPNAFIATEDRRFRD